MIVEAAMLMLSCAPGTVPGWLDETGQPTSCVGDHPCPEFIDSVPPEGPCPGDVYVPTVPTSDDPAFVPVPVLPDELAPTGVGSAVLSVAVGVGGMGLGAGIVVGAHFALRRRVEK